MSKYTYSKEIADAIGHFLTEDEWHYSFDKEKGIFEFGLKISSKIKKINYIVAVYERSFVVYGISPIGADSDDEPMMAQMAEFFCRANYGLRNGCFELDFRDGEIRFKSYVDCDDLIPSTEVIKNSIYCINAMYKRYASGIVDIVFTGATAKESIARCEEYSAEELRKLLGRMTGGSDTDGDVSSMLARLAGNLGTAESGDDGEMPSDNC